MIYLHPTATQRPATVAAIQLATGLRAAIINGQAVLVVAS